MSPRSIATLLLALALLTLPACGAGEPTPGSPPAADNSQAGVELTYVGNEGVLLRSGERKVLIDALYREGVAGYAVHSAELREQLETAEPPFDGIDLVLATHYHADHFDAAAVARHLEHNPQALFVSTPQAIERMRELLDANGDGDERLDRIRAEYPDEGARVKLSHRGVRLEVMNLHHGRERPIENLGLLVHLGGKRVLHVGDTEANASDFGALGLVNDRIDVGLIPFWHLLDDGGREAIASTVGPERLVAIHVPPETARDAWIEQELGGWRTMVEIVLQGQAEAVVVTQPMERHNF